MSAIIGGMPLAVVMLGVGVLGYVIGFAVAYLRVHTAKTAEQEMARARAARRGFLSGVGFAVGQGAPVEAVGAAFARRMGYREVAARMETERDDLVTEALRLDPQRTAPAWQETTLPLPIRRSPASLADDGRVHG